MTLQRSVGPERSYELSLPPEWEVSYDEDGVPNFRDSRRNLGTLRIKTYLFKGPSTATFDSRDFLQESRRKMPGSERIRLGHREAIYSVERSNSSESHHWVVAEGHHVLLATYALSGTMPSSREESAELATVVSILKSLRFR